MKIFSERYAEKFLSKNGFSVIDSFYVKDLTFVNNFPKRLKFPVVVKIVGEKIIHKSKLGGVRLRVRSVKDIKKIFINFKRKKGFAGIVIQRQLKGKEVFLGIKKTNEFGFVIGVGSGGSDIEKEKDVAFRLWPVKGKEFKKMLNETKISKRLNFLERRVVWKNIKLLNKLLEENPKISELDINPLIVKNRSGKIVDAQIVFE